LESLRPSVDQGQRLTLSPSCSFPFFPRRPPPRSSSSRPRDPISSLGQDFFRLFFPAVSFGPLFQPLSISRILFAASSPRALRARDSTHMTLGITFQANLEDLSFFSPSFAATASRLSPHGSPPQSRFTDCYPLLESSTLSAPKEQNARYFVSQLHFLFLFSKPRLIQPSSGAPALAALLRFPPGHHRPSP